MADVVQSFVDEPTQEGFNNLRKAELVEVAQILEIPIKTSDRKAEIKDTISEFFTNTGIWPASLSEDEAGTDDGEIITPLVTPAESELKKIEIQLRMKQLEVEAKKIELEIKSIDAKSNEPSSGSSAKSSKFDALRQSQLVPKFREDRVEEFFQHFEKVAVSLEWPKEVWPTLIQSSLVGKAQEVYASLTIQECSNYENLKSSVLRAYELVPEAHRQLFRNYRRRDDQTFVDFVQHKQTHFEHWLRSSGVDDFHKLKELVLLEEVKRCVQPDQRQYLEEREAHGARRAAVLLDEYVLTHKGTFKLSSSKKGGQGVPRKGAVAPSIPKPDLDQKPNKACFYCKKDGHVMSACWKLKKKREKEGISNPKALPDALAITRTEHLPSFERVAENYKPFISSGYVSLTPDSEQVQVHILRDTGASQSLVCANTLPFSVESSVDSEVFVRGVEGGSVRVPLHNIELKSDLVSGSVVVGILPTLPVEGVTLLLGNDIAGEKVLPHFLPSKTPVVDEATEKLVQDMPDVFPSCAVTRSMARELEKEEQEDILADTFFSRLEESSNSDDAHMDHGQMSEISRQSLVELQGKDPEIVRLAQSLVPEDEEVNETVKFYKRDGILMRRWRPPDATSDEDFRDVHQVVVPKMYRKEIISLAHEAPLAGHLGINKTQEKVLRYFFWPGLRHDVAEFCRSCHVCQVVGKPNQKIPPAPLRPIPAFEEPFSRVIVDCVGPLPRTKLGNQYLLTMMCASTRFPEAIPLRTITAKNVSKALVKFFTMVGLPKCVQSDQGSNFTSKIFQQVMSELGVECRNSSAYHPQSQGALERFHQTLKNMMRVYCSEHEKEWDEGIPLLLFAVRESVQESLGFSPFELVFGHSVRGPLKILQEKILVEPESNLLDYVCQFKDRLSCTRELAAGHLKAAQSNMKRLFDRKVKERHFEPGSKVLVLLPLQGDALKARYAGPYVVEKRVSDVNYIILTPDRRKRRRLCHVNMLKEYVENVEEAKEKPVATVGIGCEVDGEDSESDDVEIPQLMLKNSEVLANLSDTLSHLPGVERAQVMDVVHEYEHLFSDVPGRTSVVVHDVDVGDSSPVKQHPYRVNPLKMDVLRKEVQYMLEHDLIEPSKSGWSSPCVLVPKQDGSLRFCTDYRLLNSKTKSDSYPLPRIDDCIDRVGNAKYVSKFDLLKGYWQVPLSERAKELSAFVTPDGFFQYKVMPFGMKNAPATFQRLINTVTSGLVGCEAYLDDIIVYSHTWEDHLLRVRALFDRLTSANLTVNLRKCEFARAKVVFLGHIVGHGSVKPVEAKVETILNFPRPQSKRELRRFLGMTGYYRKFCHNFADAATPLTNMLRKDSQFDWSDDCQVAFNRLKAMLASSPVLAAPNFDKQFILMVDASDTGGGGALMQKDDNGVDHPVAYMSRKFNKHQRRYSTVEKETLALVMALRHFDVYLNTTKYPVLVYTDHNPLVFLSRMRNKNGRLTRWALVLQEYNLVIQHVRGKDNVIADALSRG
ncbi:uncharacterized protein [Diadema antillarum]|uniref:uncharacterized protein n=1 Tax=Diadema antillarum TaxID=105358 RepID=UPI003A86E1D4